MIMAVDPIEQFQIEKLFPVVKIGGTEIVFTNSAASPRSPSTTCTACSSSPTPACCTRGAPRNSSSRTESGSAWRLEGARLTPSDDPPGDVVVWACGAWLPQLFPEQVAVEVSRRDVFFLGGDRAWQGAPGFVDYDARFLRPRRRRRARDQDRARLRRARRSTPTRSTASRLHSGKSRHETTPRRRFPSLAGAPVLGGRVCQYDLSADTHFIVDRHPENDRWWLVGGGSGHSFKHGPALAEYLADCLDGKREREPFHALGPRAGDAGLRTGSA